MTLDDVLARYPGAESFVFGDSAELSAQLLDLVCNGNKRATCGALRSFEVGGEAMPVVGRVDIALHWDRRPAVAIRTEQVERVRFCDMPEDWALMEGEDDDLAGWQAGHQAYFARNGGFEPDMWLVWERFSVVEVFANG